jgi:SHS2 domain-containing protein
MMMKSLRKAEKKWIFLDHTADIRMEVHGATLEELFVNAALGLTSLFASESSDPPERELEISIEADDHEELLVDWLREILFQNQTKGFVLIQPHIASLTERRIEARLEGRLGRTEHGETDQEIKGVTYHGLFIRKSRGGYVAQIVFDI